MLETLASLISPRQRAQVKAPLPVIAVGSLRKAGGTGKTPTVIAIAQRLTSMGKRVHILADHTLDTPLRVDERAHDADTVGDEPLLMSAFAPTWVGRDRSVAANCARDAGAEMLLLDGGAPFGPLKPDLSILVEDAALGFGNGWPAPFGPLVCAPKPGLAQVDFLLTTGINKAQKAFLQRFHSPIQHLSGQLEPLQTGMDWHGLDVIAFAGIGVPERFFGTLKRLGANLVKTQPLEDHQEMTDTLLTRLLQEAQMRGAQLVTTEKDAVRLPRAFRSHVLVVPVRMELADWTPLDDALGQLT